MNNTLKEMRASPRKFPAQDNRPDCSKDNCPEVRVCLEYFSNNDEPNIVEAESDCRKEMASSK